MAAASAIASSVVANGARYWSWLMVGVIICSSPASWRARASTGRTQRLAIVSWSSCSGSWPIGARATKKRVSNRRGSPAGVIQWATYCDVADGEAQALVGAHVDQPALATVHGSPVALEALLGGVVDEVDQRAVRPGGEEHTGLLEALAHGRHPEGEPAARDAELLAGVGVGQAEAAGFDLRMAIGGIDGAAREHVEAAHEGGVQRAPHHEHLDAVGAVAQQHHGGGVSGHEHAGGG